MVIATSSMSKKTNCQICDKNILNLYTVNSLHSEEMDNKYHIDYCDNCQIGYTMPFGISNDYYSGKNQENKLSREDRNKLILGTLGPKNKIIKDKEDSSGDVKEVKPIDSLNNPDTAGQWTFVEGNNSSAKYTHPTLGEIFVTRKGDKWVLQEGLDQS